MERENGHCFVEKASNFTKSAILAEEVKAAVASAKESGVPRTL